MSWSVYIIQCGDNSLYTGITTDVARRFSEHLKMSEHGNGAGAKYFLGRKPIRVVFVESGHNRSSASSRESAIKKLSRAQKLALIASVPISDDS